MTNVNVAALELVPLGGATNSGIKIGFVNSKAKQTADDTWTVTNASSVEWALLTSDAGGTADSVTIATNVITMEGAVTAAHSGFIIYK